MSAVFIGKYITLTTWKLKRHPSSMLQILEYLHTDLQRVYLIWQRVNRVIYSCSMLSVLDYIKLDSPCAPKKRNR